MIYPQNKKQKNDFYKIITHEISHIYYSKIIPSGKPYWLNEGIAIYIAGQKIPKSKNKKGIRDYFDSFDEGIYSFAGKEVKKIGINKTIKIAKKFKNTDQSLKSFMKICEKKKRVVCSYSFFNIN